MGVMILRPMDGDAPRPWILAIETSCDETSVAVVDGSGRIIAEETASQIAEHRPYGGVVPELASRNHTVLLPATMQHVLASSGLSPHDFDAFAATAGPGPGQLVARRQHHSQGHGPCHRQTVFRGEPPRRACALAFLRSGGGAAIRRSRGQRRSHLVVGGRGSRAIPIVGKHTR